MLLLFLIHSLSLPAALVAALPQGQPTAGSPTPTFDVDNPSSGDPTIPPKTLTAPSKPPNPWSSGGIPKIPAACTDASNPSPDCFAALSALASTNGSVHAFGGFIVHDGSCSIEQQEVIETAAWDASILATLGQSWPHGDRGIAAGKYWMGPDYPAQQQRIQGNYDRAAKGLIENKSYITISCNDPHKICNKKIEGQKVVGGYAWTYSGIIYYYHYINFCPPFFTLSNLDTLFEQRKEEVAKGDTSKVTDMNWLMNTGEAFLHEMMHTDLIGKPHINDEKTGTDNEQYTYGPLRVHQLAQISPNHGGGAGVASTNADSYAILANCLYWWTMTRYFPGVPGKSLPSGSSTPAPPNQDQVSLYLDLGNITDTSKVDFTSLFNANIQGFADNSTSTAPPPTSAPASAPSATKPPSPQTTAQDDSCSVEYKVFLDNFEIQGKDFDPVKFGTDGSGLKKQLEGCGAITGWSFKTLTNSKFQWSASGTLPVFTKACVARAVISAGGSPKDACTGSG